MEIKEKYEKAWFNFYKWEEAPFREIDRTLFKKPFEHLPKRIVLSPAEEELLTKLESRNKWTGNEYYALSLLRQKRIISKDNFKFVKKRLKKLIGNCDKHNIKLPDSFLTFFQNQDYLARFRAYDLRFLTSEELNPFPENPNYFITLFFGDSQGGGWWYLLLNEKSEYCILFNIYHWREVGHELNEGEPPPKYLICSDSFEEFIVRLSEDIKTEEGEHPEKWYDDEMPNEYKNLN